MTIDSDDHQSYFTWAFDLSSPADDAERLRAVDWAAADLQNLVTTATTSDVLRDLIRSGTMRNVFVHKELREYWERSSSNPSVPCGADSRHRQVDQLRRTAHDEIAAAGGAGEELVVFQGEAVFPGPHGAGRREQEAGAAAHDLGQDAGE